jgi:hypothetical protein
MRHMRLAGAFVLLTVFAAAARADDPPKLPPQPIDPSTAVDHDAQPIRKPAEREKPLYAHQVREALIEPVSHAFDIPDLILGLFGDGWKREAANVTVNDEVANSSWFTNRNHVRALTPEQVRLGPLGRELMPAPPYTIKSRKVGGVNPGFTIKDKDGRRWVVKLDPQGSPQLGSGADVVVGRLLWAAGYNVSHDVTFSFRREDLKIDDDLAKGSDKAPPFQDTDLDTMLLRGARFADGRFAGQASLFLEGTPVGPIDMRSKRPDDPNDRYRHRHRRELRGLYELCSWTGSWDTKDHQSLETFIETKDSLGFVRHNLLDFGAALGAAAEGPRPPERGYEYTVDYKWSLRRLYTLGFLREPWRKTETPVTIPALGRFETEVWQPDNFRSLQPHPAFRERTDGDDYWGAKLVASFTDAQVAAAIDAAGYEDPRVKPVLLALLLARRDKLVRYYFERIAPLDYFTLTGTTLKFRDLAVDRGLAAPRGYEAEIDGAGKDRRVKLAGTALELPPPSLSKEAKIEFKVAGSKAKAVEVHLVAEGGSWKIARVRHA